MRLEMKRKITMQHIPQTIVVLLVEVAAVKVVLVLQGILVTHPWDESAHWIKINWADIRGVYSIRWQHFIQIVQPSPTRKMLNNSLQFWHESILASTALAIFKKSNNIILLLI